MARVSVAIGVYDRKRYLAEAVESVLGQRFRDFELVLIDDGSREPGIAEMLAAWERDSRVRVVRNERNRGIARVHNQALELARGEYLAVLDSDDRAHPQRLERQVAYLDAHPECAAVGSWTRRMDASGRVYGRVRRYPTHPDELRARLLFRCYLNHPSMTARTGVLRDFGYRERFQLANDFDLFVRLSRHHDLVSVPRVLLHYRSHPEQASARRQRARAENLEILASQLDELGVAFDADDLDRHFRLTRGRSWLHPDAAFLDWAEPWLGALAEANVRSGLFREPFFSSVLGEIWLDVCLRARRATSVGALRAALRSPLRARLPWALVRRLAAFT